MRVLPGRPSELIRLALEDLRKVEQDPRYRVYMGQWHMPGDGKFSSKSVCHVCLAGAVMAMSLDVDHDVVVFPEDFPPWVRSNMQAINSFRTGSVFGGLSDLGLWIQYMGRVEPYFPVREYGRSREGFHIDMGKMADMLEEKGL